MVWCTLESVPLKSLLEELKWHVRSASDLGTTDSIISVLEESGEPTVITDARARTTPSVITLAKTARCW